MAEPIQSCRRLLTRDENSRTGKEDSRLPDDAPMWNWRRLYWVAQSFPPLCTTASRRAVILPCGRCASKSALTLKVLVGLGQTSNYFTGHHARAFENEDIQYTGRVRRHHTNAAFVIQQLDKRRMPLDLIAGLGEPSSHSRVLRRDYIQSGWRSPKTGVRPTLTAAGFVL